eukprot:Awhi_evm1s970
MNISKSTKDRDLPGLLGVLKKDTLRDALKKEIISIPGPVDSKQLLFRAALNGLGFGWVATNTATFRFLLGQLWKDIFPDNKKNPYRRKSLNAAGKNATFLKQRQLLLSIANTAIPPSASSEERPAILLNRRLWQRYSYAKTLRKMGVVLVRNAVTEHTAKKLLASAQKLKEEEGYPRATWLSPTQGNGNNGLYLDWQESENGEIFDDLHKVIEDCLREKMTDPKKVLCMSYNEGGVNWAHQDANKYPYQALLMLTTPGVHFNGGEFYVAKRNDRKVKEKAKSFDIRSFFDVTGREDQIENTPPIATHSNDNDNIEVEHLSIGDGILVRHSVTFTSPGDLCIFRSSGDWFHGMSTLKKVEEPGDVDMLTCQRVATGLFQPAPVPVVKCSHKRSAGEAAI